MVHTENNVGVHLDEAAIAVVGKARVARTGCETFDGAVVEAQVEDRVHHAGHGRARARTDRDEQRICRVAEGCANGVANFGQSRFDFGLDVAWQFFAVLIIGGADLR